MDCFWLQEILSAALSDHILHLRAAFNTGTAQVILPRDQTARDET